MSTSASRVALPSPNGAFEYCEYQDLQTAKSNYQCTFCLPDALTLWCLAIISLAYIKLPPKMFGMEIPEQRIDATYSAGLLGNLLASYGISIGGMSKKKKRENGEGQNGSGSSNNSAETVIRLVHDVELKVDKPKIDPITKKPIDPVSGRLETT